MWLFLRFHQQDIKRRNVNKGNWKGEQNNNVNINVIVQALKFCSIIFRFSGVWSIQKIKQYCSCFVFIFLHFPILSLAMCNAFTKFRSRYHLSYQCTIGAERLELLHSLVSAATMSFFPGCFFLHCTDNSGESILQYYIYTLQIKKKSKIRTPRNKTNNLFAQEKYWKVAVCSGPVINVDKEKETESRVHVRATGSKSRFVRIGY